MSAKQEIDILESILDKLFEIRDLLVNQDTDECYEELECLIEDIQEILETNKKNGKLTN